MVNINKINENNEKIKVYIEELEKKIIESITPIIQENNTIKSKYDLLAKDIQNYYILLKSNAIVFDKKLLIFEATFKNFIKI